MIIRRLGSTDLLISQPEHAALGARIMRQWHSDAREIDHQSFASAADARRVVASATVVTLKGQGSGA
jgi:hypothetical protein